MRLKPDQRHALVDAIRRGIDKKLVASVFNTSVKTVSAWCKRSFHRGRESFQDKPRESRRRMITMEVELAIIAMRTMFEWGTARIQQGLINLPEYARKVLTNSVENVHLSRTAINDVLTRHRLNGYKHKSEGWKFFRASRPNELWQLDIKGPYRVQGKKYWFVVCIDDYSRFLILAEQIDHCPDVEEIGNMLMPCVLEHKPKKILTDNSPFKQDWDAWCRSKGLEPLHAHPYYPQDKGKVERAIRNVSEEFVYLLRKFPEWLDGKIHDYRNWFNDQRFHRGVKDYPSRLFREVGNLT